MKWSLFFLVICLNASLAKVFAQEQIENREPAFAGRFYPSDSSALKTQIKALFSKARPKMEDSSPLAIIVPHAGFVYSGEVAASGFNQIAPDNKLERIFIIGSSHTTLFKGISVYCQGNYKTPLGTVKVDLDLAKKLVAENSFIIDYAEPHVAEHSLEVQLPFLQVHLRNVFKIVPIIVGSSDVETIQKLANVLRPYLNDKNLFVVSSDFSHYPTYTDAETVDKITVSAIQENDPSVLLSTLADNKTKKIPGLVTSLCGWTSVLTLLYMTESLPDISVNLIQYKNSGDSEKGKKDRVVGYHAISFTNKSASYSGLCQDDCKFLLQLARETITQYLRDGTTPNVDQSKLSTYLNASHGVFVTIKKNDMLRGCVGRVESKIPLWTLVELMAVASATQDYRFPVLTSDELPQITIEITVLSKLKRIYSEDEFVLGKHGIQMKKGNRHGTFLPQVAQSRNWTKEEFLEQCAEEKLGISRDAWKSAELYTFEALIFEE
jgi:MEMO1 family protein